jgi:hypothetical protein
LCTPTTQSAGQGWCRPLQLTWCLRCGTKQEHGAADTRWQPACVRTRLHRRTFAARWFARFIHSTPACTPFATTGWLPTADVLQEEARVHGGLYALRIVARKYEFRDEEERAPMNEIINTCFPVSGCLWEREARGPCPQLLAVGQPGTAITCFSGLEWRCCTWQGDIQVLSM